MSTNNKTTITLELTEAEAASILALVREEFYKAPMCSDREDVMWGILVALDDINVDEKGAVL